MKRLRPFTKLSADEQQVVIDYLIRKYSATEENVRRNINDMPDAEVQEQIDAAFRSKKP